MNVISVRIGRKIFSLNCAKLSKMLLKKVLESKNIKIKQEFGRKCFDSVNLFLFYETSFRSEYVESYLKVLKQDQKQSFAAKSTVNTFTALRAAQKKEKKEIFDANILKEADSSLSHGRKNFSRKWCEIVKNVAENSQNCGKKFLESKNIKRKVVIHKDMVKKR